MKQDLQHQAPWANNTNSICFAHAFRLQRNLQNQKFPSKMDSQEKKRVLTHVSSVLSKLPQFSSESFIAAEDLSPVDRDYLLEHYMCPEVLHALHIGGGVQVGKKGHFLCILNLQNHLQILFVDKAGDPFKMWKKLATLEATLEKELFFAFSPRFGYLTAKPEFSGTSLEFRVYLQLPALLFTQQLEEVLANLKKESLVVSGIEGKEDFVGDILVAKNTYCLGVKEETILGDLHTFVTKLEVHEKGLREQLKEQKDVKLFDLVGRAVGLLKHSYRIELVEALSALSKMKMGVDLGWIKGVTHKQLNYMLYRAHRGHLLLDRSDVQEKKEDVDACRADFFREALKKLRFSM